MTINIEALQQRAKETAKNLNHWKKQGITDKTVTIDGLLTYCDEMDVLCKRVKDLEKGLQEIVDEHKKPMGAAASFFYADIARRTLGES